MQPLGRARMLALAIAAAAIAAAGVASSSASSPPHPARGTLPQMSSAVPYVAPWQSGFERFSTQLYQYDITAFSQMEKTVPDGQWWRIIYSSMQFVTGATVANRIVFLWVVDRDGNTLMQAFSPAVLPASGVGSYLFGPNITTFANTAVPTTPNMGIALPDLLWPPGSVIRVWVTNGKGGDQWSTHRELAVEVYTPVKERPGVFVPTPAIA